MMKIYCSYDEVVDITKLVPNPRNPNQHPDKQIELLAKIIEHQGWRAPITVSNRSGFIVRGHGRLMAAECLGLDNVPVDYQDYASEAEEWADLIADNRLSELSSNDNALLKDLLQEIDTGEIDIELTGYFESDIEDLMTELQEEKPITEDDFDPEEEAEKIKEPVTKYGDLWKLGRHFLLCGDSTSINDVQKLMQGNLLDMVFTDPPYNVNYGDKANMLNDYQKGHRNTKKIANDHMSNDDFKSFLYDVYVSLFTAMKEGAPLYVCHADTEGVNFRREFNRAGFKLTQCIIWAKNSLVLGRQDYQWKHEPILYGWKPGASHKWFGGRKQTTVWEDVGLSVRKDGDNHVLTFTNQMDTVVLQVPKYNVIDESNDGVTTLWRVDKPRRNADHPTMKPIMLCAKAIQNSSKEGDIVGDWFLGSGSTLIAAEQLKRRCYGTELEPLYCDVIIKRWEEFTGQKAELISPLKEAGVM